MLSSKYFVKVVLRFQYVPGYVMFKIELYRFKILKFCTFYHEMHFNISYKGTHCKKPHMYLLSSKSKLTL